MRWPTAEEIFRSLATPPDVQGALLTREDIPALCAALDEWHPDVAIGEENRLLAPALYEEQAFLLGEDDRVSERPVCVVLFKSGASIVGLVVLEFQAVYRALFGRMAAVDPRWRARNLGGTLVQAGVDVARAIGAELVFGLAELDNLPPSAILDRVGLRLCGIIPDSERRRSASGAIHYVPEAIYVKVLVPPEDVLWPRPEAMTPRTAALYRILGLPGADDPATVTLAESYRPAGAQAPLELDPAVAALVASRPGGVETWPDVAALATQLDLPDGLVIEALQRADIPAVIARLPQWFPDIVGSSQEQYLDPSFYDQYVALQGEEPRVAERPNLFWVVKDHDAIISVACGSYDAEGLTLRAEVAVIDPARRARGVGARVTPLNVLIARALGAETIVAWATMKHRGAQTASERAGWQLWGVIPASERYAVAPGVVKRGCEALYGISLVPPESARWPDPAALSPHRAALVRFIQAELRVGPP
jgi:N-acetylglutamate synthase-like GNAT family acetyltransferase